MLDASGVGWLTANDLDHWRTPIDCRDHPEFEVSRVLQTSLPAFNLPKLAAEISSCRTNTGDHLQGQRQTTAAVGPNSPAVSAHSGSVLSHRCANITTLREELQAIQTGISRVLSGFYGPGHQLSVASTPQRPLPPLESDIDASGPWPTSGNSSMSAPAGNMGSSGSTEYSLLSQMLQNHNQIQEEPRIIPPMQLDQEHLRRLATLHGVNSQGGFAVAPHDRDEPRVGPPVQVDPDGVRRLANFPTNPMNQWYGTTGQRPPSMPPMTAPVPHMPMEGPSNAGDSAPASEPFDHPAGSINYNDDWSRGSFMDSFLDYDRMEQQRRMTQGPIPGLGTNSLYANGQPRQAFQQTGRTVPPAAAPIISHGYTFVPPPPFSYPAPTEAQHVPNVGVPHHPYPEHLPRTNPNHYVAFTDASQAIAQQRRRQSQGQGQGHNQSQSQSQSLTADVANTPPNNSPQHNRRRPRRSDDQGPHYPRRSTPPRPDGRARQSAAIRYADMANLGNSHYYSMLTDQQRTELVQRLHLTDLLRNMRPEDLESMQLIDAGITQARRFRPGPAGPDSPSPSKGLDNQNDGRPDPKETDELTVNMECKSCMTQLVDTVLLPCGHAILCRWCAAQHMPSVRNDPTRPKGNATCPLCRKSVKQKLRIYLS